jgi:hypothetical protein
LPLEYQWYRNDQLLPTEKSASLHIAPALLKHLGVYKCEVRNASGASVVSLPVALDFLPMAPEVLVEPGDRQLTEGDSYTLQTKGACMHVSEWMCLCAFTR